MKFPKNKVIRILLFGVLAFAIFVLLPSSRWVRKILILPLFAKSEDPTADVAYVMAGGRNVLFERLRAATDLYHMGQVKTIYYLEDQQSAGYNFSLARSETAGERALNYIRWLGVPSAAIRSVPQEGADGWMSSMDEARWFAKMTIDRPGDAAPIRSVVIVTSAPHSRRSLLCFQRVMGDRVEVKSHPATAAHEGAELFHPIWYEYLKLSCYLIFAY